MRPHMLEFGSVLLGGWPSLAGHPRTVGTRTPPFRLCWGMRLVFFVSFYVFFSLLHGKRVELEFFLFCFPLCYYLYPLKFSRRNLPCVAMGNSIHAHYFAQHAHLSIYVHFQFWINLYFFPILTFLSLTLSFFPITFHFGQPNKTWSDINVPSVFN